MILTWDLNLHDGLPRGGILYERIKIMKLGRFWRTVRHLNADQWRYRLTRRGQHYIAQLIPGIWSSHIDSLSESLPIGDPTRKNLNLIADQTLAFQTAAYGFQLDDMALGKFTFLGETVDFGGIDKIDWRRRNGIKNNLLWRLNLGYMGYTVPWLAKGNSLSLDRTVGLIHSLQEQNSWSSPGVFKDIWNPYTASHRLINLLSGLNLYGRAGGNLKAAGVALILNHCRYAAAYVAVNLERDLQFNHLMKNYVALAVYVATLEKLPSQWSFLPRAVMTSVNQNFLSDGGHVERSPMYHLLGLLDLRILKKSGVIIGPEEDKLIDCERQATQALSLLSHPDGDIALFNDSWLGDTPSAAAAAGQNPKSGRHDLSDTGYVRLDGGDDMVIMDVGPCGPDENPAHAHADFLSVEVSVGGKRFLVDPGTTAYAPGTARDFCRSASSHNGPHLVGAEPIEFWNSFRVGRRGTAIPLKGLNDIAPLWVSGRQNGYGHLGVEVRRFVGLWPDHAVIIADLWIGESVTNRAMTRFLIPSDWHFKKEGKGSFACGDCFVKLELAVGKAGTATSAEWWPNFGVPKAAHEVSIAGEQVDKCSFHGLVIIFYWGECPRVDGHALLRRLKNLG